MVKTNWIVAPPSLTRYNGFPAVNITGTSAPDSSSGDAMKEMEAIVGRDLPRGFGFDWAGQSLQEILSGNEAPLLFALSILVVYLCLAALYESWVIPVSVMLAVPLGVIGAAIATTVRGTARMTSSSRWGLITIIGLTAKNAILIVEFAVTEQRAGKPLREAVLEAARLRFRPIMMTSFAFILGVMPLVVSTGARGECTACDWHWCGGRDAHGGAAWCAAGAAVLRGDSAADGRASWSQEALNRRAAEKAPSA